MVVNIGNHDMGRPSKPLDFNDPLSQNWDTYRFFLAVARAGSISAAAKFLKESPPTVGRKIRELEVSLSAQLFERSVAGVKMTIIGQKILDNIQDELKNFGISKIDY